MAASRRRTTTQTARGGRITRSSTASHSCCPNRGGRTTRSEASTGSTPTTIGGPGARRVWKDEAGREIIEVYSITGMGHGTPIEALGENGAGVSGAYMLDVHISSTRHIARFWGLAPLTPLALPLPPTVALDGPHANENGGRSDAEAASALPAPGTSEHALRAAAETRVAGFAPTPIPSIFAGKADAAASATPETISVEEVEADAPASECVRPPLLEIFQVQADLATRMMIAASMPWWWRWARASASVTPVGAGAAQADGS